VNTTKKVPKHHQKRATATPPASPQLNPAGQQVPPSSQAGPQQATATPTQASIDAAKARELLENWFAAEVQHL